MYYSVKELRQKISEKVLGIGISSQFKENPAFASALSQIDSLIGQMNMFEASEKVFAIEEKGRISFNWTSSVGDKYSMIISSSSPETFKCIRTEERKPFIGTNGQTIKEKNVIEEVTTIDKSGFITLVTNGSMINNINCGLGKCNNSTWSERKYYTVDGIMRDREYKGFLEGELTEDFDTTSVNSILYIPRQAFDFGFWHNKYNTRTVLTREKLDTARIYSEDRSKGIIYSSVIKLNNEHSLRDMNLQGGYNPYPEEVIIEPLSQDLIELLINKETNPKVKEGLRKLAVGRDSYYYNSNQDHHFICEDTSKGVSR